MSRPDRLDQAPTERPVVLLVDDDEVNLMVASAALRQRGFAVHESNSGQQALASLGSSPPSIILLDANMPDMDGFQTCAAVRARPGFANIPVLMLTALDDDDSLARAFQAGATDFFVKCSRWSLLAARIRYLLRAARTHVELARTTARLTRAQDLARMGSFDWRAHADHANGSLRLSPEALHVFGLAAGDRLSVRTLLRMVPRGERRGLTQLLREVVAHRAVLTTDVLAVLLDGRRRTIHVEAEPEFGECGQRLGYTGIVQDVTDRRAAEDRIRRLANFDMLTGLPNRNQLLYHAERAIEQAQRQEHPLALLLVDLDRFKVFNDTLGHAAGDEMLIEVARRLRGCLQRHARVTETGLADAGWPSPLNMDTVGRLGGDEFVALLPHAQDLQDAELLASRIHQVMDEPILVAGQECFVTASVAVVMFPRDGTSANELLGTASMAISAARSWRASAFFHGSEPSKKGRSKLELESALHKAIEREELLLYYQPKVDVPSAQLAGVEALIRWRRGDTLIMPGDFIPLAEETGLIVPLSEWALREAARQVRAWRLSFDFAGSIAVNLPGRMFERSNLIEHVQRAATANGIPPRTLQLEITETGLMRDLQSVVPSLHRLHEIGVDVSIDDFGTGYSSLAYLTTLPISAVKIDRTFVQDLGVTLQSSAVIAAIVALAGSLGLEVIAEGVENLRQMRALRALGCSIMQGFLFSRPLPPDDLELWLRQTLLARNAVWIEQ